jgi:hypothetical protein
VVKEESVIKLQEQEMKVPLIAGLAGILAGCAGANIWSGVRESGEPGSSKMIRCADLRAGNELKVNDELAQYDGWKMVYVSEYTTPNKARTAAVMCFEKPF